MAAGQGFKTFVTGEVLTSGDVNGYLMQGINVFTNATARDAAITAPAEGQFAFTKDNNSLWYYDGAAWVASGATGDIEGVTAGVGISGGGTSGTVTVTNSMATAIDAKGDLVPGTGADTFARLAVGANGTVLTADSAETTGLKWAAAASGATAWTLLSTTTLTGAATITVSSLSAKELLILMVDGSSASAASTFTLRLNGDTAANYTYVGNVITASASYASGNFDGDGYYSSKTSFKLCTAGTAPNINYGSVYVDKTDSTGWKKVTVIGGGQGTDGQTLDNYQGIYEASAAITSVSVISSVGNFDEGTLYILGAN